MLRLILTSGFLFTAMCLYGQESGPTPQTAPSSASASSAKALSVPAREVELAKAVERQEQRHFEMHKFYIPPTQGNLQWLSATVGAKPNEAAVVWKLMRAWDNERAIRDRS